MKPYKIPRSKMETNLGKLRIFAQENIEIEKAEGIRVHMLPLTYPHSKAQLQNVVKRKEKDSDSDFHLQSPQIPTYV
jgi:hypothetical protein